MSLLALCVAAKFDRLRGRREAVLGEDDVLIMYLAPLEIANAHMSCKNPLRKHSRSLMVVIELGSWMSVGTLGLNLMRELTSVTRRVGVVLLRTRRVVLAVLGGKGNVY